MLDVFQQTLRGLRQNNEEALQRWEETVNQHVKCSYALVYWEKQMRGMVTDMASNVSVPS